MPANITKTHLDWGGGLKTLVRQITHPPRRPATRPRKAISHSTYVKCRVIGQISQKNNGAKLEIGLKFPNVA